MKRIVLPLVVVLLVTLVSLLVVADREGSRDLGTGTQATGEVEAPGMPSAPPPAMRSSGEHDELSSGTRQPAVAGDTDDASSQPPGAFLRVRVVAQGTGAPLAGVEVSAGRNFDAQESVALFASLFGEGTDGDAAGELLTGTRGFGASRATDSKGEAEILVPPAVGVHLAARGRDGLVGERELTLEPLLPGESREVVVEMTVGGGRYCGRVLERGTGSAVVAALVRVLRGDRADALISTHTDGSGRFEVTVSPDNDLTLQIDSDTHGRALAEIGPGHETPDRAQIFRLARAARIRGRVLDSDGAPDEAAGVWCGTSRSQLMPIQELDVFSTAEPGRCPEWTASTDERGEFLLAGLPPRVPLKLILSGDFAESWDDWVSLAPGEERVLDVRLLGAVTLRGRVVDERESPVGACSMWLKRVDGHALEESAYFERGLFSTDPDEEFRTEADGSFQLGRIHPGTYLAGPAPEENDNLLAGLFGLSPAPRPESSRHAPCGRRIVVLPEPESQYVVLQVERGRFLSGVVLDAEGRPVDGALVSARSVQGVHLSSQAGAEGEFTLGPVVADTYVIRAERGAGHVQSLEVRAEAGAEGIVLRLAPSAGSIQVVVPALAGWEGHASAVLTERGRPAHQWWGGLDDQGSREFEDLEARIYDLVVVTADGELGFANGLEPAPEAEPVLVTLVRSTTVRVTDVGQDHVAWVRARRGEQTLATGGLLAGSSTVLLVPPGALTIEWGLYQTSDWTANPPSLEKTVLAVLGEEPEVVFP